MHLKKKKQKQKHILLSIKHETTQKVNDCAYSEIGGKKVLKIQQVHIFL